MDAIAFTNANVALKLMRAGVIAKITMRRLPRGCVFNRVQTE